MAIEYHFAISSLSEKILTGNLAVTSDQGNTHSLGIFPVSTVTRHIPAGSLPAPDSPPPVKMIVSVTITSYICQCRNVRSSNGCGYLCLLYI